MDLDIAIIPSKPILFNTHGKSPIKFFELSVLRIPVVASNTSPYREVIEHGENGLLARNSKEWLELLKPLIQDRELRTTIGQKAHAAVWKNFSFNHKTIQIYKDIFI